MNDVPIFYNQDVHILNDQDNLVRSVFNYLGYFSFELEFFKYGRLVYELTFILSVEKSSFSKEILRQ